MQQCRYWRRSGALYHQLAMGHDPDHGVKDLAVGQSHDVIHEALHHREGMLAHSLHTQAVDDAIDLVQGDHMSGFNALLHRWTVGRLYANDLDPGIVRLQRHGDAGDQPAAADRNYRHIDLREVLKNLETERSLAGDELHVIKRMDVGKPPFLAKLLGFFVGLVP